MRKKSYQKKLKLKIIILIVGIILLVGQIVFQTYQRSKEKKEYENMKKQIEMQKQEEEQKEMEEWKEVEEQETQEEVDAKSSSESKEEEAAAIPITNLSEYATDIMGDDTYLLEQSLAEWIEKEQLSVASATIIHVMVPENDPESIQFFVRMNDEQASLVMLSYHPRENVVTASSCTYTEEEIEAEVWENNGPEQRDISPEEEEEILKEQEEANDTDGEN